MLICWKETLVIHKPYIRNNIDDLESKETLTRARDSSSGQPGKFGDIELQQLLNENQMQTQEASCATNLGSLVKLCEVTHRMFPRDKVCDI